MRRSPFNAAVVIPLHNKQNSIVRAVASALNQTHPPSEVIVVDDGSTDKGVECLAKSGLLSHVRLIQQAQQGPGPARNSGWEACNADWIAFLDADDAWKPNHLESLMSAIATFPSVEWAATTWEVDWGTSRRGLESLRDSLLPLRRSSKESRVKLASYFWLAVNREVLPHSSSTVVKRSALEAVGGFPDALPNEDLAFWCVLALRGDVAFSGARTVTIGKDGVNITKRLRDQARTSRNLDPTAVQKRPDVAVIFAALHALDLHEEVRYSAERYADFLLTRHWVTTILDSSQLFARESLQLIRHRQGRQFHLFRLASRLPSLVAGPAGLALSILVEILGYEKPVSPFVDRDWQGRHFQVWLDGVIESLR